MVVQEGATKPARYPGKTLQVVLLSAAQAAKGPFKAIRSGHGGQVDLSTPSSDGVTLQRGYYVQHPTNPNRVFTELFFPPGALGVQAFGQLQATGAKFDEWTAARPGILKEASRDSYLQVESGEAPSESFEDVGGAGKDPGAVIPAHQAEWDNLTQSVISLETLMGGAPAEGVPSAQYRLGTLDQRSFSSQSILTTILSSSDNDAAKFVQAFSLLVQGADEARKQQASELELLRQERRALQKERREIGQLATELRQREETLNRAVAASPAGQKAKIDILAKWAGTMVSRVEAVEAGVSAAESQVVRLDTRLTNDIVTKAPLTETARLSKQLGEDLEGIRQTLAGLSFADLGDGKKEVECLVAASPKLVRMGVALGELTQLVAGELWESGVVSLATAAEVLAFVKVEGPFPPETAGYLAGIFDLLSHLAADLNRIKPRTVNNDQQLRAEAHAAKIRRTEHQSQFLGTYGGSLPAIMGKEDGTLKIDSFKDWDGGDMQTGLSNTLTKMLVTVWKRLRTRAHTRLAGKPRMCQLMIALINHTELFWGMFRAFINSFYLSLFNSAGGKGKEAKDSSWELVSVFIILMFDTLDEKGADAQFAYQLGDESEMDAAFITASLKVHHEMEMFIKSQFSEHPDFTAKLVRHMFESSVSRAELSRIEEASREAAAAARKVATAQETMKTQVNKLDSKMERVLKKN